MVLTRFGGLLETEGVEPSGKGVRLPRTRPPYPPEFRRRIVELAREGRSAWDLAKEFEPNPQTIRSWIRQAEVDDGRREGVSSSEREELRRLRREVEVLREEKEILAKAAAWFAGETGRTPRGRSSS